MNTVVIVIDLTVINNSILSFLDLSEDIMEYCINYILSVYNIFVFFVIALKTNRLKTKFSHDS